MPRRGVFLGVGVGVGVKPTKKVPAHIKHGKAAHGYWPPSHKEIVP